MLIARHVVCCRTGLLVLVSAAASPLCRSSSSSRFCSQHKICPNMSMQNKVMVITGGSSGFGKAMALAFAKEGAYIVVADVDDKGGLACVEAIENMTTRNETTAVFVHCDVTKRSDLARAISTANSQFGRPLDVMINNAGIAYAPGVEFQSEVWKKIIQINLTAVLEGTQLAVEEFKRAKKPGVILNVASTAGIYPQFLTPAYSAAKSGVIHFTRAMAALERSDGIRVVAVAPNFFDTPLLKGLGDQFIEGVTKTFGILSVEDVVGCATELILDSANQGGGAVLRLTPRVRDYWPPKEAAKKAARRAKL